MNDSAGENNAVADEDIIGVLTAISVVSKRLARKMIHAVRQKVSDEGGTENEQNTGNVVCDKGT